MAMEEFLDPMAANRFVIEMHSMTSMLGCHAASMAKKYAFLSLVSSTHDAACFLIATKTKDVSPLIIPMRVSAQAQRVVSIELTGKVRKRH